MTGADTTILIQLADIKSTSHTSADALVQGEILAGHDILIAPQTIAEFLHVITDSRRFQSAISMTEALDWVAAFLGDPNVKLVLPTEQTIRQTHAWMRQFQLGRKRILDTMLAATLHGAGCTRLMTSNSADFTLFNVFDLLSP